MFNFFKKDPIFKTNPSDRPSVRYSAILLNQLEREGYKFLKSKNEFVQEFEFGKRILRLSYDSSFGYIASIQYFYHIVFNDIEKNFKKIYPKYGWTNWTIHLNLHWTDGWLCDKETGQYTDITLNKVANDFFTQIKPQIDIAANTIKDYPSLQQVYNTKSAEHDEYLFGLRLEKRIINGLILVQNFEPAKLEFFIAKYIKLLDQYNGFDKDEVRKEVEEGITFLRNNFLKINTESFT
jgi:hypothetical protein